jgi:(p)ppGpp synthase/HD superfamily hydrolase
VSTLLVPPVVTAAYQLARVLHADQRYGDRPYEDHLFAVYDQLDRMGYTDDPMILAAAWLHDALEDTDCTIATLEQEIHPEVAALVQAVTGVGPNRRARNADIYRRLAAYPAAIPLKVADRICNVESCWSSRDARLFMYHREYPEFRATLRAPEPDLLLARLWGKLDGLLAWRDR